MSNSRKERGKNQHIYLIEKLPKTIDFMRKFIVMGNSGNVYNVEIKDKPSCTCPDYMTRSNRCKHIYFVLIRIMKVSDEDKCDFTKKDLSTMFKQIPKITDNLVVDNLIKSKYDNKKINSESLTKQKSTDDLCPICLDDLENGDKLDYCKYSCGKSVHLICFGMWKKSKGDTCVFCRQNWNNDNTGYVNILC
jgi:hypothetical protein